MAEPSFVAVNLEDISQPNCFKVLDVLRDECSIPVWYDDAQGTACVTLVGLINAPAVKLVTVLPQPATQLVTLMGAPQAKLARVFGAYGATGG